MNGQEYHYYFDPDELHPPFLELVRKCPATMKYGLAAQAHSEVAKLPPIVSVQPLYQSTTQMTVSRHHLPVIELPPTSPAATAIEPELPLSKNIEQCPPLIKRPASDQPSPSSQTQPPRGPRISVHALGQFAFCARAGVLASESKDESDHGEGPIRLTYLPNFNLALIEEELFKRMRRGALLLVAIAFSFGLLLIALQLSQFWLLQAALVLAIILAKCFMDVAGEILVLARRRYLAITARPLPPLEEVSAITAVNWWSLLKSGFEPVNLQAPLRHPALPLEGNPWRVLQYGSLRIPVILSDSSKLGPNAGTVFPKHQLRLAAYSLLLSSADHIRVPYGLVFPANSPRGLAIPLDQELTSRAIDFVRRVRSMLHQTTSEQMVPALPPSAYCATCPFGKPEAISHREIVCSHRAQQNLLLLTDPNGRYFHCRCGDRFQSAPPHRAITRRQLVATIERQIPWSAIPTS